MLLRYALIVVSLGALVVGCRREPAERETRAVIQSSDTVSDATQGVGPFDTVATAIQALQQRTRELQEQLEARDRELAELRQRVERLEAARRLRP